MIIHVRVWILPELNLAARTHHPQYPLSSRGPWNEFKSQGEGRILPQRGASQAATRQTGRAGCAWALLDSWTSCAWNQILPSAKHFPLSMKSALNPPHLQGHWWHCQVAPGSKCFRDAKLFFFARVLQSLRISSRWFFPYRCGCSCTGILDIPPFPLQQLLHWLLHSDTLVGARLWLLVWARSWEKKKKKLKFMSHLFSFPQIPMVDGGCTRKTFF